MDWILNIAFFVFHTSWIAFNCVGWIWRRTRPWQLATVSLTAFAWFGVGAWYGWGYCGVVFLCGHSETGEWFAENPAAARLFADFQASLTSRSPAAVASAYDFSSARFQVTRVLPTGGDLALLESSAVR